MKTAPAACEWRRHLACRATDIVQQVSSSVTVDVILPIRPKPPRLIEVLRSLREQEHQEWRLIALLDRDTGENHETILDQLPGRDICFIRCNYQLEGFSAMLNRGIALSTAELIARQDDDDVSLPSRFQQQVKMLTNRSDCVASTGFATVVNVRGEMLSRITQPLDEHKLQSALISRNVIPHTSVMFRRSIFNALGGYREDLHGCEDYHLWLRMLCAGKIVSVGSDVVQLLYHQGGMSRSPLSYAAITELNRQRFKTCRTIGAPIVSAVIASGRWSMAEMTASRILRHRE